MRIRHKKSFNICITFKEGKIEGKVLQEKRKKKNIYTYPVKISCLQEITMQVVKNNRQVIISEKENIKYSTYSSNVKDNDIHKNCNLGAIFRAVIVAIEQ